MRFFSIYLDPLLARRALLDVIILLVVLLLVTTLVMNRPLQIVPAIAVSAGVFCFRYIQLRRARDVAKEKA